MQIFVKTTKTIAVEVDPDDTILMIKGKIEEREGISQDVQRLIFCGKELANHFTVERCRIQKACTLHLIIRHHSPSICSSQQKSGIFVKTLAGKPVTPEVVDEARRIANEDPQKLVRIMPTNPALAQELNETLFGENGTINNESID